MTEAMALLLYETIMEGLKKRKKSLVHFTDEGYDRPSWNRIGEIRDHLQVGFFSLTFCLEKRKFDL